MKRIIFIVFIVVIGVNLTGQDVPVGDKIENKMKEPILGLRTVCYMVPDLEEGKSWYTEAFGVKPYFDEPFYVGFNIGGYELGLLPTEGGEGGKSDTFKGTIMIKQIEMLYGNQKKLLDIDEDLIVWIKDLNDAQPLENPETSIREVLHKPIGTPPLSELVKQFGKETIILVDDSTRCTPQHLILPILLDELNNAGVPDSDITILIALGTHRSMTDEEVVTS